MAFDLAHLHGFGIAVQQLVSLKMPGSIDP
jgi:hypothetical protein